MFVVSSFDAIKTKYPGPAGTRVRDAIQALGPVLDASGLDAAAIRDLVDQQDPSRDRPVCLVGGYDLVPGFNRSNPTLHAAKEFDQDVLTDALYGARPGSLAETFLPTRAVSRIPDSGLADADAFVALLERAALAPTQATPAGTFQQAAHEFRGSAGLVHKAMPGAEPVRLSPPDPSDMPSLTTLISGRGRVHILLHGSDKAPDRSTLWGKAASAKDFVPAATAADLAGCRLDGAIVTFGSCYSAMLDGLANDPPRAPDNQVALACLAAGAKVVFGATRANWIDIRAPFVSFASALTAHVWLQLGEGVEAAEALRLAKRAYARRALAEDASVRPYVLKTLLQAQCYGHPLAKL